MNIHDYYNQVRATGQNIGGPNWRESQEPVWITSVDNPDTGSRPGQTTTANPMLAAELIVRRTHRLATDEEVQGEQARLKAEGDKIRKDDADAKGKSLSPDVQALVTLLAANNAERGRKGAN